MNKKPLYDSWNRHRVLRAAVLMLVVVLALPLIPYAIAQATGPISVPNPGTDLWRDLRGSYQGKSQVQGVDTGILIADGGERWRQYRTNTLVPYSTAIFGGMIGIFILYRLFRGKIQLEDGRSGRLIRRYTSAEITVHWIMAITFVTLALTGLILLYGRWVLIPLLGPAGFSITATVAKNVHNYVGLLFTAIVPIAFFLYLKDSLFNLKVDGKWFMRAGGYLGGGEPSSEKVNAGQKSWYWVAMLGGVVLIVTGLILNFPNFQQGRELMQWSHLFHTITAVGVTAFFFVHLYLATIGVEGAFESMVDGHVDENWAKQHHDLWYREAKDSAVDAASVRGGGSGMIGQEKPTAK